MTNENKPVKITTYPCKAKLFAWLLGCSKASLMLKIFVAETRGQDQSSPPRWKLRWRWCRRHFTVSCLLLCDGAFLMKLHFALCRLLQFGESFLEVIGNLWRVSDLLWTHTGLVYTIHLHCHIYWLVYFTKIYVDTESIFKGFSKQGYIPAEMPMAPSQAMESWTVRAVLPRLLRGKLPPVARANCGVWKRVHVVKVKLT